MEKKMNVDKLLPYFLSGMMLLSVVACGSDDDDDDDDDNGQVIQQEEQVEGTYRATLLPANPLIAPVASGTAEVIVNGDSVSVNVNVENAPTGMHMQHIHLGTACAQPANDANSDGYIDAQEASPIAGPMLVPFDDDISTQMEGHDGFPSGRSYQYDEVASFNTMLSDLLLTDTNPNDSLVKLNPGEDLTFEGRVVEVHGVPSSTNLPSTVGSIDGEPNYKTLPILCGVLERVQEENTTGGTTGTTGGTSTGGTTGTTGGTTGTTGGTTTGGTTGTTGGTTGTSGGTTTGGTTGTTGGTTGTTDGTTTAGLRMDTI